MRPGLFSRFVAYADQTLRADLQHEASSPTHRALLNLALQIVLFGMFYGGVMGCFGGVGGDRAFQILYSAIKVPLLLIVTFCLSLPSFFVLNTLLGVRADFPMALRALVATQAGLTLTLASFAPFTLVWYASSGSYQAAVLFNGLMFGIASFSSQWLLYRYYRPLLSRNAIHLTLLRLWVFLYAFVGIQMGWVLRPFIGDLNSPLRFFREDSWGNAYQIVFQLIWNLLFR
jgi:hypothetical protein